MSDLEMDVPVTEDSEELAEGGSDAVGARRPAPDGADRGCSVRVPRDGDVPQVESNGTVGNGTDLTSSARFTDFVVRENTARGETAGLSVDVKT